MKKRILWIDILRIIGMLGVIIIHVVGNTINTLGLSGTSQLIYNIICKSCYFTLPLFVMISGMMLLNKDINIKEIFVKYIKRIILVIIIFGAAFVFMEEYFIARTISIKMLGVILKRLVTGNLWAHMWYLYLVIELYLMTPLLRKWIKHSTKNEQICFLILLYILTILKEEICNLTGLSIAFNIPINTGFIFAYVLGNYLYNNELSKKSKYILYSLGIISFISIILLTYFNVFDYLIGYTSTLCITVAASVLYLFKNKIITNNNFIGKTISILGECSFGIYIIHQFFINIIYKVLEIDFILRMPYLGLICYILIILIPSFVTIFLLRKIKLVKKHVL